MGLKRNGATMFETISEQAVPIAKRAIEVRAAAVSANRKLPRSVEWNDLVQEAILRVLIALRYYDPGRASLGTFIERVAGNVFASLLRTYGRQPVLTDFKGLVLTHEGCFAATDRRLDMERILAQLPEADRRLLLLLTEVKPGLASRKLQIPRSSVYHRLARMKSAFAAAGYNS